MPTGRVSDGGALGFAGSPTPHDLNRSRRSPDSWQHPSHNPLEAGAGDSYWYDVGAGMLHLKLVTRTGKTSATLQVAPQ